MRAAGLFLILAATASAQPVSVEMTTLKQEVVQERLEALKTKTPERRATLGRWFHELGCECESQAVPHTKDGNLLCTLAPEQSSVIVVGAHFDFADRGQGAADNWSGASLLPSVYQSLAGKPRRHRIVFVGFAAEETGLNGSREYVKRLSKEERANIRAMVNIDTVGLSKPTVWLSRADKKLADAYAKVARTLSQEPYGVNADRVGDDDAHPFLDAKIPVISFHSVTQENLPILHSMRDTLKAIDRKQYYEAYRLASLFVAYIDAVLEP
jgi:hypothetical protein